MTTTNSSHSTTTTAPLWQAVLDTPFANTQYSTPFGSITVTAWDGLAATAGLNTGYKIAQAADALRWAQQEARQARAWVKVTNDLLAKGGLSASDEALGRMMANTFADHAQSK